MGSKSIRFENMKIAAFLAVAAHAQDDDRKVPPRHPLQRLDRLVEFSAELLDDWYSWLPSQEAWKNKFANNGQRMKRNFERGNQRCGFYDENQPPHGGPESDAEEDRKRRDLDILDRYDRTDPAVGTKQITTGFRKWAQRFLSECSGQRQYSYQVNRMNMWNNKLQMHLANNNLQDSEEN